MNDEFFTDASTAASDIMFLKWYAISLADVSQPFVGNVRGEIFYTNNEWFPKEHNPRMFLW